MLRFFLPLCILFLGNPVFAQPAASPEISHELYELERIAEVRLYFYEPDWAARLDSLKGAGGEDRLTGTAVVDGRRYEQVGVRYKGNSSFNSVRKDGQEKLPLNIKINHIIKNQRLPGGYETIKLSNVFRDPSFLREVLAYEIAGSYLPAPRANFARVYVNDRYLGFYNNSESVDERFLQDHYGSQTGVLIKCDPIWDEQRRPDCPPGDRSSLQHLGEDSLCYMGNYELKSDYGWRDLVDLTRILEQGGEAVETLLDVDQTLWMLAFNNVLVNLDSYSGMLCHNYYLYRDPFGTFHPIVWDMNLAFGGFRYSGEEESALTDQQMHELSPFMHFHNKKRPLISQLLAVPLYRKVYIAHIRTILEDHFANGKTLERAHEIHRLIDPMVAGDTSRLYSYEEFLRNLDTTSHVDNQQIIGLSEFIKKRAEYLAQHPLIAAESPRVVKVGHRPDDDGFFISASVQGAERCWLFYRYAGKGNFMRQEMTGHPADSEQPDEEFTWTATVGAGAGLQYYLVAETEKTASLSPPRASKEFYVVE